MAATLSSTWLPNPAHLRTRRLQMAAADTGNGGGAPGVQGRGEWGGGVQAAQGVRRRGASIPAAAGPP